MRHEQTLDYKFNIEAKPLAETLRGSCGINFQPYL